MDKQALLSILKDLAPPDLFEGVEGVQSTKELLPLLDAELQRSSNRMQRIQQYRNKLSSPMYSLLPELLSKIFVVYATDGHELFNMRWTRLLLVCRRWYDVGVSTPKLWSYISLVEPSPSSYHVLHGPQAEARLAKRIEAQLARAGGSPLTIKTGMFGRSADVSEYMQPYRSVFWEARSLASISLSGEKSHVAATLKDMAAHRHPILKEISITYDGMRFSMGTGPLPPSVPPNTPLTLPDSLLGEARLSTLAVNGVHLNWALVQNLRVLHATFDDNTLPATSLQSIANALGRCPLLEDLRMMLPTAFLVPTRNDPSDDRALSTTISLKHLRKVAIRANSDVCAALFQAFENLPRSARISLLSANTSSLQQISHLSSLLGTHGRMETAPAIHTVSLTQGALFHGLGNVNFNIQIVGQGADLRATQLCVAGRTYLDRQRYFDVPFAMTPSGSTHISLSAIPSTETTNEIVLANILQSWPLARATSVDLRACRSVAVPLWRALFDNMPSATTVVLRPESHCVNTLLELLNSTLRDDGRLVVRNIILDTGELGFGPMSTLFGGGTAQESPGLRAQLNFMRVLEYCAEAAKVGLPLDTVELVNDDVHAQIDRMIHVGPETDWSELYSNLSDGFVYEGVLRNATVGPEGVKKDSFVGSKSTKVNDALHRYARRLWY